MRSKMLHHLAALAFASTAFAALAVAEEKPMTGPEIGEAFTGNTVRGIWNGTEYLSYFDANGSTTYVPKGGKQDVGTWRVKGDQYCSTWGSTEDCYDLRRDGDQIIWLVPGTDKRYPSTLLKGKVLSF
jgi:hypothetical protein